MTNLKIGTDCNNRKRTCLWRINYVHTSAITTTKVYGLSNNGSIRNLSTCDEKSALNIAPI